MTCRGWRRAFAILSGAALLALQHPAHAAETLFGGTGGFLAGDDAALAEHVNLQLFGKGAQTDGFDEYDTQDLPHLKTDVDSATAAADGRGTNTACLQGGDPVRGGSSAACLQERQERNLINKAQRLEQRDDTAAKAAGDLTQQGPLDAVMQRVAAAESVLQAAIAARKALRDSPMGEFSRDGGSHEGPAAPDASPLPRASDDAASGHVTAGVGPGLYNAAEQQRRRMLQAALGDQEDAVEEEESPDLEASVVTDDKAETFTAQWQYPLQQDSQPEAEASSDGSADFGHATAHTMTLQQLQATAAEMADAGSAEVVRLQHGSYQTSDQRARGDDSLPGAEVAGRQQESDAASGSFPDAERALDDSVEAAEQQWQQQEWLSAGNTKTVGSANIESDDEKADAIAEADSAEQDMAWEEEAGQSSAAELQANLELQPEAENENEPDDEHEVQDEAEEEAETDAGAGGATSGAGEEVGDVKERSLPATWQRRRSLRSEGRASASRTAHTSLASSGSRAADTVIRRGDAVADALSELAVDLYADLDVDSGGKAAAGGKATDFADDDVTYDFYGSQKVPRKAMRRFYFSRAMDVAMDDMLDQPSADASQRGDPQVAPLDFGHTPAVPEQELRGWEASEVGPLGRAWRAITSNVSDMPGSGTVGEGGALPLWMRLALATLAALSAAASVTAVTLCLWAAASPGHRDRILKMLRTPRGVRDGRGKPSGSRPSDLEEPFCPAGCNMASSQTPTSAIQPRRLDVDLGTSPVMNPLLAAAQLSPAAQHAGNRRPMVPRLKLEHMHFPGIAPEGSDATGNDKSAAPSADSGFTFSSTTNSHDSFGGSGATAWQWQEVPSPQWLMRSPSY